MAGIFGILDFDNLDIGLQYRHFHCHKYKNVVNEQFQKDHFTYGRSTLNKFLNDRFLHEFDDLVLGIEGFIYRKDAKDKSFKNNLYNAYRAQGISIVESLDGQYCGFIFDQKKNKLFVFTDHVSSRPLYFYFNKNKAFCFSSEPKQISTFLQANRINYQLNHDAFKYLLTVGYMVNDCTPIEEIKKIPYGSYLELDISKNQYAIHRYFRYKKGKLKSDKDEIINRIDSILRSKIKQEWEKDIEYNFNSFAFLSGGLDSRVNVLLGEKYSEKPPTCATFSYPRTSDIKIAKKITSDYGLPHQIVELHGSYLINNIKEYISANDGLTLFFTAAHAYHALKKINFTPFGIAHSGQIGDVIFGSFSNLPKLDLKTVNSLSINKNPEILSSIEHLKKTLEHYSENDSELFNYEQRQFNGTLNGDRMLSHFVDSGSPFYDRELIELSLSIHPSLKKNQLLYFYWIAQKHPEISDYKWQKSGFKPKNYLLNQLGFLSKKSFSRLFPYSDYFNDNMNPFNKWFKESSELNDFFDRQFDIYFTLLKDKELKSITRKMYKKGDPISKMAVISALLTVDLYFNQ